MGGVLLIVMSVRYIECRYTWEARSAFGAKRQTLEGVSSLACFVRFVRFLLRFEEHIALGER